MSTDTRLHTLAHELRRELTQRILPYWSQHAIDEHRGGFYGSITRENVPRPGAPRSAVLNARILWTFAAAHRALGDPELRTTADRAAAYIDSRFVDPVHGGVYWSVDAGGEPADERKLIYAQAFAVYGLSEHYRATGCEGSLRGATGLFRLIEQHAHDDNHGGYREAFSRDWVLLDDSRLGEDDEPSHKSMNTQLHLLEAWTSLYRVWPDLLLADRLRELVEIFLERIVDAEAGHSRSFFDADWTVSSDLISYGHDIETSWLLIEAAGAVGHDEVSERARRVSVRLAETVLDEAVDARGGVYYSTRLLGNATNTDKEWWVQAEAIVGFINAYQETGNAAYLDAAVRTWEFVRRNILDLEHGEWHRRVTRDGQLRPNHDKVGPWKCPYHNARACLEVMRRVDEPALDASSAISHAASPQL